MQTRRVLVVDDDESIRKSLSMLLGANGFETAMACDGIEALERIESFIPSVVLADVNMPRMNGLELLEAANGKDSTACFILITGYGNVQEAVKAMKRGAYEYVTKPVDDDEILMLINRFFEREALRDENAALRRELDARFDFDSIIGHDHKMQRIYDLIEMVADTAATVMIEGENGTGKSMIARAIHHNSSRTDKPFIEVSCGALAETLLESELFGHRKGSFTGAIRDKVGKFEAADGGTIFLDEIGAASKSLQLKLLRVLQERRFEPVGGNRTVEVDVRVIAASNVDLLDEVNEGRFREDLYYRLNIMQIHVPPLRDRVGDIRLLGKHFFDLYNERYRRGLSGIAKEALRVMERYGWPGNVRELENAMERAVIVCRDGVVRPHDLPRVMIDQREDVTLPHGVSLTGMLEDTEKEVIRLALDRNNGRRKETARELRINRTTLFKKMKKYELFGQIK